MAEPAANSSFGLLDFELFGDRPTCQPYVDSKSMYVQFSECLQSLFRDGYYSQVPFQLQSYASTLDEGFINYGCLGVCAQEFISLSRLLYQRSQQSFPPLVDRHVVTVVNCMISLFTQYFSKPYLSEVFFIINSDELMNACFQLLTFRETGLRTGIFLTKILLDRQRPIRLVSIPDILSIHSSMSVLTICIYSRALLQSTSVRARPTSTPSITEMMKNKRKRLRGNPICRENLQFLLDNPILLQRYIALFRLASNKHFASLLARLDHNSWGLLASNISEFSSFNASFKPNSTELETFQGEILVDSISMWNSCEFLWGQPQEPLPSVLISFFIVACLPSVNLLFTGLLESPLRPQIRKFFSQNRLSEHLSDAYIVLQLDTPQNSASETGSSMESVSIFKDSIQRIFMKLIMELYREDEGDVSFHAEMPSLVHPNDLDSLSEVTTPSIRALEECNQSLLFRAFVSFHNCGDATSSAIRNCYSMLFQAFYKSKDTPMLIRKMLCNIFSKKLLTEIRDLGPLVYQSNFDLLSFFYSCTTYEVRRSLETDIIAVFKSWEPFYTLLEGNISESNVFIRSVYLMHNRPLGGPRLNSEEKEEDSNSELYILLRKHGEDILCKLLSLFDDHKVEHNNLCCINTVLSMLYMVNRKRTLKITLDALCERFPSAPVTLAFLLSFWRSYMTNDDGDSEVHLFLEGTGVPFEEYQSLIDEILSFDCLREHHHDFDSPHD